MMPRHFCQLLVAFVLAAAVLATTPANACSPPPDGWVQTEAMTGPISGVIEGAFVLPVAIYSANGNDTLGAITIDVRDPQDAPVEGTLTFVEALGRPIWRARAPLTAGATYTVRVDVQNSMFDSVIEDFQIDFQLNIGDEPALAGQEQVRFGDSTLVDRAVGNNVCCPVPDDFCLGMCAPPNPCEECWSDAYTYLPRLETELQINAPDAYQALLLTRLLIVEEDGSTSPYSGFLRGQPNTVDFNETRERYCVGVETWDLITDTRTVHTAQTCLEANTLVEGPRREVDLDRVIQDVLPMCESFPEGYDINGPIPEPPADMMEVTTMDDPEGDMSAGGDTSSGTDTAPGAETTPEEGVASSNSGCSQSRSRQPAPSPWMVLLLAVAARLMRRRLVS